MQERTAVNIGVTKCQAQVISYETEQTELSGKEVF